MAAGVSANIARLTALGLQVHITELDVPLPVDPDGSVRPGDLARQAEIHRSIVGACLNNAGCTAIQTWGFTDRYSWIGSHSKHTLGAAIPFDRDYRPKAAHRRYWKNSPRDARAALIIEARASVRPLQRPHLHL